MCLEIGNKVAVLDDVIKGEVINISGNNIRINSEDGMELWFDAKDLVKINVDQNELDKKVSYSNKFIAQKREDEVVRKKSGMKKMKNQVVMEVDLHIEKLVKSTRGLDKYDMLALQIDVAKRKVEYCVEKKISKIIFIHGVGEGVLKTELQYLLQRYPVKYYDASFQKYGAGATEVYVYQNA